MIPEEIIEKDDIEDYEKHLDRLESQISRLTDVLENTLVAIDRLQSDMCALKGKPEWKN